MKKIIAVWMSVLLVCSQITVFAQTAEETFDALEQKLPTLEQLIVDCEESGLDVSYERADYEIISDFIDYGREDISWGHTTRADYVAETIDAMYTTLEETLNAYLTGKKAPLPVVRNYAGDFGGISGTDFVNKDGEPIISNGYGSFEMMKNDLPRLQNFGADIAQIEIGPRHVVSKKGAINGWSGALYGDAVARYALKAGGADGTGNCLQIVNETPADAEGYLSIWQRVNVEPETTYTVSLKVRTVGAQSTAFSPNGWVAPRVAIAEGSQAWTTYSATYTTQPGEYYMEVLLISKMASRSIFIDDITLCKEGSNKNLVQNGDFDDSESLESEHFQANYAGIGSWVTQQLDRAYAGNVMVNVLLSPHYFPEWLLEEYPETTLINSGCGYDMNHEIIREAMDLYIHAVMEKIKDHPALHSICITNEPTCDTRNSPALNADFAAYLKDVYQNDLTQLNLVYGSEYTDFSQITMPTTDSMDARYYDWVAYNDQYTASWHKFLADTVRKYAPRVPVHAKMMTIFGKSNSLNFGIDPEDFAEFTQCGGNDAWGFYGSTAGGLISKLMWYDLLKSIQDAPIINSEDHIIEDRNQNFHPNHAIHIGADIWQGAVHGRDASIAWIWARSPDPAANTYGNILYRPDALSIVSRRSFDLNRLAKEVTALQKAPSEVSILYSPTSRAYQTNIMSLLTKAYTAGLYSGANPQFITERQLSGGKQPSGLLVVPGVTNLSEDAFLAISEYRKNGGRVIMIGNDCLARDEHNLTRDGAITPDKQLTTSVGVNALSDEISALTGAEPVKNADGNTVRTVEKITARYRGAELWNLCNYSWSGDVTVSIPGTAENLLSGETVADEIVLKSFQPVLLRFGEEEAEYAVTLRAEAERTAEQTVSGILATVENEGDTGFFKTTILLKNAGGTMLGRADFTQYIPNGEKRDIRYGFRLPEGTTSAELVVKNEETILAEEKITF